MSNNSDTSQFIKLNDNTIINENYIQWMKKIGDCIYMCNKVYGCDEATLYGAHRICKTENLKTYSKIEKYFY
jgi:hypothetical protein